MKNINAQTRKKQVAIALSVVLGLSAAGGVAWYVMSPEKKGVAPPAGEPAPDMTGVVNTTFDDKVQKNAIIETQKVGKEVSEKFKAMQQEIRALSDSNAELQRQVNGMKQTSDSLVQTLSGKAQDAPGSAPKSDLPVGAPGEAATGGASPPLPGTQGDSRYGGMGQPQQGQIMVMPPQDGGIRRQTFSRDDPPAGHHFPYIPSGSYAESVVIEGADASAAVTGAQNTSPMQLRLTGKIQMPNDREYDLTGCFVTLEAYGDVSSERAEVRTRKLSCNIGSDVIDQKIEGHVSFMGKNGIKGEVVMRNGKVLGFAWGAGFLSGIGKGIESAGSTTVGVGTTASPGAGDIMKSGVGGGTSEAAKTLSEYYIKRAEQYHPVIPVGAGNDVTLVFNDGFQIQTVAELLKAKQQKSQSGLEKPAAAVSREAQTTLGDIRKFKLGDIVSADGLDRPLSAPAGKE